MPLRHAFAKDWPAHLLRAHYAHGARICIEPQAAYIEPKIAVLKQATHLTFLVFDQVFVEQMNAIELPRYHAFLLHEIGVDVEIINGYLDRGFRSYAIKHALAEVGLIPKRSVESDA